MAWECPPAFLVCSHSYLPGAGAAWKRRPIRAWAAPAIQGKEGAWPRQARRTLASRPPLRSVRNHRYGVCLITLNYRRHSALSTNYT